MANTGRRSDYQLRIGDQWTDGANGSYPVLNPATEEIIAEAPEASVSDVKAAVAAACEAFDSWSRTSGEERAALLLAVSERVLAKAANLVPLVQAETGATIAVAEKLQVPVCAARFREYAGWATREVDFGMLPAVMPDTPLAPGGLIGAVVARQPVGVAGCITPYNFPLNSVAGKIGPALAMGNTVVIKPAPQDPLAVLELVRIIEEVGFPPGVVNLVTGSGPEVGIALVESPDVDLVSFTGSSAVGSAIYASGSASMKRLLLELGGKGAAIILEDADLATALTGLVSVWSFHSGQICTAPTRAIVHASMYDELVERLAAAASELRVGDPLDPATVVGPVISAAHRDRIESYVASGRDEGAEIVVGGTRPAHLEAGFFVAPTLLAGCRNDMRVSRDEIFGPVISVISFDQEEEAIALANDCQYGLSNYVYSRDTARADGVGRRLRVGNVGVNTLQQVPAAPFGGFKMSGIGRADGEFGVHAYTEVQSIVWSA